MTTRREFISGFGLGVVGLAGLRLPDWLQATSEYRAEGLGFAFTLPPAWQFVSAQEVQRLRDDAVVPGGDEGKREAVALAGEPLVVASRFGTAKRGPTLIIWRQAAGPGDHAAEDSAGFASVHTRTYRQFANRLRDFKMEPASPVIFAGRPASRCRVACGEDNDQGESWTCDLRSQMFRVHHSWVTVNFVDLASGWTPEAESAFRQIEKSFVFFEPRLT